jgi:hypothetical protein
MSRANQISASLTIVFVLLFRSGLDFADVGPDCARLDKVLSHTRSVARSFVSKMSMAMAMTPRLIILVF